MSARAYLVSPSGTLERMPPPLTVSSSSHNKDDKMKIIIPKVAMDNFREKLQVSGKYVQNNEANSLNIRDYVENRSSTRHKESHVNKPAHSFQLKAWS